MIGLNKYKILAVAMLVTAGLLVAKNTYAHAFGERYDLPIPLNFFLVGGAATVAFSFVIIGLFVRQRSEGFSYPRYDLLRIPVVGPIARHPVFLNIVVRPLPVFVLAMLLVTSFVGTDAPLENLSPTFIWIIWWVGMGYISALAGNVWMLVSPWKVTFEWIEKLFEFVFRRQSRPLLKYPERLDVWPAFLLFFGFAWLENVFPGSAVPFQLGVLILLYSLITWAGMIVFGKHTWLRHGEAFSVLFGFFARFAPTEVHVDGNFLCGECDSDCGLNNGDCVDCYECFEKAPREDREINLRPFAVGLIGIERVSTATAVFVVFALAAVTFDGLQETPFWAGLQSSLFYSLSDLGPWAIGLIDTLGIVVVPALFFGIYLLFASGIQAFSNDSDQMFGVAKAFVFSLVPIALAYNMAHFLSLLLIQGQQIIPLASDPFGFEWNLFGTADYKVNIAIINAKVAWFISLIAIVLGHVISVYVAHVIALRRVPDHKVALRGQYPMLVLMVIYTATSLWIIAQPIVEN